MVANITIGYKFIPTDKELILHYLRAKAKGQPLLVEGLVNECNLYDDQELLKIFSKMRTKSKLYYYFRELKKKNGKGKRIDRMMGKGMWKGLDRGKPIHDNEGRLTGRK
ncbi:NAC domain containing protein 50 [Camellia lanceoleosa]|uniref:NAC domain containing protein 50 n=1 Tax=Camellia lanceoleosa TaxID=1840588 RepID=A0ACC0IXW7_9ERIC|nr:NAC domain containing protein 50 [Camellia lanceoleosa]